MRNLYLTALLPIILFAGCLLPLEALALTVSPVRVEVSGDPGQTLRGEMQIMNEQNEDKVFFSSYENFEPSGETGAPRFVGNTGNLSTWLQTESRIDIKSGETIIVPYTITIPADTEPGGYFSAIFWGSQDPSTQQAGEVAIGGKLGVLILLRVNGPIREEAGLSDFTATDGKRWFTALPIDFSYRFTNKGADRVVPLGDITVKNIFGMESAVLPANSAEGNVLPNSTRKFQLTWGNEAYKGVSGFAAHAKVQFSDFHFGLYRAHADITWGSQNTVEHASTWFILFPWQALTVILVALVLFVGALKLYNRWIISRSSKSK
jgi:hypothetical protein